MEGPAGVTAVMQVGVPEPIPGSPLDGAPGGPAGGRLALRGGLWSAAAQLLPSAGVALLSVTTGRILGADALGRQSLIAYVAVTSWTVVAGGLVLALLQCMGQLAGTGDEAALRRFSGWVLRTHVVVGFLLGVGMSLTGVLLHRDQVAWLLVGCITFSNAVASGIYLPVVVKEGWSRIGRVQLITQCLAAPLGVLAVLHGLGVAGVFAGDAVASAALLGFTIARLGRHPARRGPMWVRRAPRRVGRLWGGFALSQLINQVVGQRIEFVALAVASSGPQLAMYSIAFMVAGLVVAIPNAIAVALLPQAAAAVSGGRSAEVARTVHYATRLSTLFSLPLAAVLATVGPVAVSIIYGSNYSSAARLVPLTSLALLTAGASGVCGQYWASQGRISVVTRCGAVAGLIDISVAFASVPALGATGAVIANLTGQTLVAASLVWLTTRESGPFGWARGNLAWVALSSFFGWLIGRGAGNVVMHQIPAAPYDVRQAVAGAVGLIVVGVAVVTPALVRGVCDADETIWLRGVLPPRFHAGLVRISRGRAVDNVR